MIAKTFAPFPGAKPFAIMEWGAGCLRLARGWRAVVAGDADEGPVLGRVLGYELAPAV
jgi:hypothetical protein